LQDITVRVEREGRVMKLTEILELIHERTSITAQWEDPEYLANLLVELASLYSSLSAPLANLEADNDYAENNYKTTKAGIIEELASGGMPVGRAEEAAKLQTTQEFSEYTEAKKKARTVFLTRQNLDKVMDAIRSKLSYIKRDMESSRHGV